MPEVSSPTQKLVAIKEIRDGVVYLKKGGLRKLLVASGINFDLKSEEEQSLILRSFQNFLNALDFPVQFFIHSRKINVNNYLQKMEERKQQETNELLKIQIEEYIQFIKDLVEQNAIISKDFFVVVPYESLAIETPVKGLLSFFKSSPSQAAKEKENIQENLEQLSRRVDQIADGLAQIGIKTTPLNNEELIELFYNLYNPEFIEKKDLEIAKSESPE